MRASVTQVIGAHAHLGDSETAQLSCTVYKFQTVISVLLFGLPGFMVNFVLVSQCLSVPWQDSVVVKIKDC